MMTEFKKCAEPDSQSVNYFIDFNQIGYSALVRLSSSDHKLVFANFCSYGRSLRSGIMRVNLFELIQSVLCLCSSVGTTLLYSIQDEV